VSLSRRNFVARVCPTPIVALVSVGAITMAGPSLAQDGTESSAEVVTALDEVLVTARRREENLMTVPIAVTALSAAALEERNIDDMMGVANFTPGLHFTDESVSSSSGRNDRTIFSPIIRGNSLHRGTVFIDGTPVASNSPPPFADVARIEVLKGPQAVYFGRSTYTGAINFITRDPSATFGGRVSGEYGSYGSNKAALSVEGPIVDDRLTDLPPKSWTRC
jgi:iron complex outermembrane receptor protein